ncbi:MAG TPA: universal stress protein [Thermoleophilaceae bacterium]|jgi:nucleotide-binding universal stress UspA family protein|nr:universal stress protein [Thermoleophilaceae bacterium]
MFRTVVAGTDGSPRAERAVQEAIDLCKSEGARLHLVAAFGDHERHWESVPTSREVAVVDLRSVAESILLRDARRAEEQGIDVDWAAREGTAADAIIDAASDLDADVIVIGNKGMTSRKRFLLGSVPEKVSRHAPCSVMIVNTD